MRVCRAAWGGPEYLMGDIRLRNWRGCDRAGGCDILAGGGHVAGWGARQGGVVDGYVL